jgi:hypothetical protein
VIKTIVNVVGTLSEKDEINQILNIVKVFLVEERMKDLTYGNDPNTIIISSNLDSVKENKYSDNILHKKVPNFTVRGLN